MKEKRRSTKRSFPSGQYKSTWIMVPPYIKPDDQVLSGSYSPVVETQITASEGHPFPPRKGGLTGDVGGEFFTTRTYVVTRPGRVSIKNSSTNGFGNTNIQTYQGPAFPITPTTVAFPPTGQTVDSVLNAYGAQAVARCKPTNSIADASTFLGELAREGIPHALGSQSWKTRNWHHLKSQSRAGGKDYLNLQFGWMPLVNEIRSFAAAVRRADSVLSQFERDSGRVVRRRYNFPSKRTVDTELISTGTYAALPPGITAFVDQQNLGNVVRRRETLQRRWFSGAFTYHLPTGYDSRIKMAKYAARAEILLGVAPTPETLWNLAPWSWAVDWFTSTGDVISNLTDWSLYGLVMRYGYLMEHTIVKDTYTIDKTGHLGLSGGVSPMTFVTETKLRKKANPFGFGITWEGLSPYQLSIAAALGLAKS